MFGSEPPVTFCSETFIYIVVNGEEDPGKVTAINRVGAYNTQFDCGERYTKVENGAGSEVGECALRDRVT